MSEKDCRCRYTCQTCGGEPDESHFVQVVPAAGWWSYWVDLNDGSIHRRRLPAFALDRFGIVHSLDIDGDGLFGSVDESPHHLAVIHDDDVEVDLAWVTERAAAKFKRSQEKKLKLANPL